MHPHKFPAAKERTQREVHILDERARLVTQSADEWNHLPGARLHIRQERARVPAARVGDASLAPDAARAVEVEKAASGKTDILLALDVGVEADLLGATGRLNSPCKSNLS